RILRTASSVQASLRTIALWMGSDSDAETSVIGVPAAPAHTTAVTNRRTDFTITDCIRSIPYNAARSYSALNSQPMSAIKATRYIQTISAMPVPIDPYITL